MGILLISTTGILLSLILTTLAIIHIYWGLGGKWGFDAAIPTNEKKEKLLSPGMPACFTVAFGLLFFALIIAVKSEIININMPPWLVDYGTWVIAAVFLLRAVGDFRYVGFFKKIRSTGFAKSDSNFFSPLCLLISLFSIALAIYG